MDELTNNDAQNPAEPEQSSTDYGWLNAPAEPADDSARAWTETPAEPAVPVDPAWAAPASEPAAAPARPAWTPAVWEPAAPAPAQSQPQPQPEASAPAPPVEPAPVEVPAVSVAPVAPAPVEPAPVAEPPAVETPVEEKPAANTSLLKKEISFRRKPKTEKTKAEKTEKPSGGSFLKKEISFGRKPKAAKAETPKPEKAEKAKKAEKPSGGSLLKKDISFGRKPKAAKAEAPKPEKAEKPSGGSLLKKDISFGRKPKAAKAEKVAKPKREKAAGGSLLKKDISLGGLKLAKRDKQRASGGGPATHKKLVGLKIGASQLAAARVTNNGSAQLVQLARQALEPGIVVGGELRDPDALAEALKSFFAKNKLPKRGVRLGLANNRIGVRIFELEDVGDPRQLTNAVRFRAQDALPIPIDEAVLDYQIIGERVDEEGKTVRRVLLVVAYRELIDRYVAACRKAGLQLVGIDLEAFALLRALSDEQPDQPQDGAAPAALVAVSIGHDRSTFAVSDGRICEFTRVLDWGGGKLDVAVARALDLAPSEAEPFKRAVGLEGVDVPEGLTEAQTTAARDAIRREVQTFARELVSSLQFYQNQPGSLSIAEIVVTGGTAHLEGLADQLQKLIGVRVRVGDPLAHVRTGKRVKDGEQIGSLTVAIGLGVER